MARKNNNVVTVVSPFAIVDSAEFDAIETPRKGRKSSGVDPIAAFVTNPNTVFEIGIMGRASAVARTSTLKKALREAGHDSGKLEVKLAETGEELVVKSRSGEESWQPEVRMLARFIG